MQEKLPNLLMRVGTAFAFLYPPLDAIADPYAWVGYFPSFLRGYVPDLVLLHVFGVVEVIVALWILSGKKIFTPSVVATLMLLGIVIFDSGDFQVLFRDLAIAAMPLSLAVANASRKLVV